MKIYYSNISSSKLNNNQLPPIGVLISYYGLKVLKAPEYSDSLFLDSGAFSAWNQNTTIDVNDYISFIKDQEVKPDVIASLDNITDYKISMDNFKIMEKAGLSPLPCFHYGEPFWVLDEYLKNTSYVALGGVAKVNKNERVKWLNAVFSKHPKVKEAQFHGFGIQDRSILLKFPWYSVDSSSVHIMARFGGICTPWGDFKINPSVNYKDLRWVSPESELKIKDWVVSLNPDLSYEKAKLNNSEGTNMRVRISVYYYEQLAVESLQVYNKKLSQKGIGLV